MAMDWLLEISHRHANLGTSDMYEHAQFELRVAELVERSSGSSSIYSLEFICRVCTAAVFPHMCSDIVVANENPRMGAGTKMIGENVLAH